MESVMRIFDEMVGSLIEGSGEKGIASSKHKSIL